MQTRIFKHELQEMGTQIIVMVMICADLNDHKISAPSQEEFRVIRAKKFVY